MPPPIRLLINNRNPDQRGTFVNIPGYLTDLLADPVRNRFYIVAQDTNQVLVFDGTNYSQIAALKTSATPTQIAFTFDRKYLIDRPRQRAAGLGLRPGYACSVRPRSSSPPATIRARSPKAARRCWRWSAMSRTGGPGVIDRIDFAARRAIQLPSLGDLHQQRESRPACSPPRPTAAPSWWPCRTAT